ncbi:MAG: hypothetical protein ACJ74U_18045 [Jatrophihabitantaceae bacterium]
MTELRIHQLRATVPELQDVPELGGRVRSMLRRVAEHRLDAPLAELALPAGEWCVRRLDVTVPLDIEDNDASIERHWAASIAAALSAALAAESDSVIRYRRLEDALDDLVGELTAGRLTRAWAWRQLGLLDDAGPAPEGSPAAALLAALRRRPETAGAALVRLVRRDGIVAAHRMLGGRGWQELAAIVAGAAGAAAVVRRGFDPAAEPSTARTPRAATVLERSELAAAVRRAGLRPDAGTARAWSVLVLAEADPAQLRRADAGQLVAEVAERLAGPLRQRHVAGLAAQPAQPATGQPAISPPAAAGPAAHPGVSPDARQRLADDAGPAGALAGKQPVARAGPAGERRPAADQAAEAPGQSTSTIRPDDRDPESDQSRRTATTGWAGLLFLLATAATAGVPDALLADPALADRTLRWALHRIALLLIPVAADDPAALCFAGLSPFDRPPVGEPPTATEAAALDRHARRWALATRKRLQPAGADEADRIDPDPIDPDPIDADPSEDVLFGLARRRGVVLADPGWIEVWLELAEVDLDVRRAGLDIDPGWLPWLGVVVRYRYG